MAESNDILSRKEEKKIRCAMNDEQYHELYNQLSDIEGLLELVRPHAGDKDLGMIVGLNILQEKTKAAQALMGAAWDRTREASHGR